jgi:hypothetical protein
VSVAGEILTIEYRAEALVQHRVAFETTGRGVREVSVATSFPHRYPSPQPFLPPMDETEWHPARRLAPYRPRRPRGRDAPQTSFFSDDEEATTK